MTLRAWMASRREHAKKLLDAELARARRFGWCDGRGECTGAFSHTVRGGRRYCSDCGRPWDRR